MEPVQLVALVVSLGFTAIGVTLFVRMLVHIVGVVRSGGPARRTDRMGARVATALKETLLHTRMLQWTKVGVAHWIVMVGFGLLFATLVNAYGQLFSAHFILPVIGHFPPFEWVTEAFAWGMLAAIVPFMVYRATRPRQRVRGEPGRLYGSTMWQGYFVEWVILTVGVCILMLRFLEYAIAQYGDDPANAGPLHFPLTFWAGELVTGLSEATLSNLIWLVAMTKIVISMVWMIVLGRNATMGVAWHRFLAPVNLLFKREPSGRPALGAVAPLTSGGRVVSLEDLEDLDEDARLGVGRAEDFSWKAILDFTTCTECGRCQSQCPAWNTEKPLSPKLLITALRDHTYATAPYLQARRDGTEAAALAAGGDTLVREVERPLIGDEDAYGVIDPDVLWSCTTCGACVQQCPVDIEHVDHIVDMRRYQLLVESNFPAELNQLFRGLENKGNPWNMAPTGRLEWTRGLDFDVPVVGEDVSSLAEVEWLFWVGCAGAYEDRAKKTTRAVAELLHTAGVSFAVLGNGETCTGDPARRAGNEFVFQGLAAQNVETLREYAVTKVVATCAHCFNTLRNEYRQLGVELEVVHHTQLLNRLVRDGRLTPIADGAPRRTVTYHDPCYLGRHNQVYSPPRELLEVLPGATLAEMPRNSERSFCCGAGGARMWMEERIGERINMNRTAEAVATGADRIAVGCPFCRVMLADGLTAQQATGAARAEVEVLDVAQLLLAAVRGEPAAGAGAGAGPGAGAGHGAEAAPGVADGGAAADQTTRGPSPVAPAPAVPAPAGSLFDRATPVEATAAPSPSTAAPDQHAAGSSPFDTAPTPAQPAAPATEPTRPAQPPTGSLFDTAPPPAQPAAPAEEPTPPATGSSLFDVAATPTRPTESASPAAGAPDADTGAGPGRPASLSEAAPTSTEPTAAPAPPAEPTTVTRGSLFDVAPAAPTPGPAGPTPPDAGQPSMSPMPTEKTDPATERDDELEPPTADDPDPAPRPDSADGDQPRPDVSKAKSLFDL